VFFICSNSLEGKLRDRTVIHSRAKALRKTMSGPEVMLWTQLRGRGDDRPTFRRQHPIGSIIVDFYCPSARLAIEVDGATHWGDADREKDEARDRWLSRQGIVVLRIPAGAVYRDLSGVVDGILWKAEERGRRLAPSTTRSSAGGPPPAIAAAMGEVGARP
jgi:very-short-patch-repair endonuclease